MFLVISNLFSWLNDRNISKRTFQTHLFWVTLWIRTSNQIAHLESWTWRTLVRYLGELSESTPARTACGQPERRWHVQLLQIEIQNLKDALDASVKKADRYCQLGAFHHHLQL